MAVVIVKTNVQDRVKDSYASSPVVGLALRANGEETVQVMDRNATFYSAGIVAPTAAPTVVLHNSGGTLTISQYYAYVYVYASNRFPFVETTLAINGKLYPRGNQSTYVVAGPTTNSTSSVTVTVTNSTDSLITTIWIFRTASYGTAIEAQTAAQAGQAFFIAELNNPGTAGTQNYTDGNPVNSADQVETDNFAAPQFAFTVYYDPYWWGFGNLPFSAAATWDNTNTGSTALVTLTGSDIWFDGRNGQIVSLSGITTGGFDGAGSYYFLWLTNTTATLTLDQVTPAVITTGAGSGIINIQGPSTTLYRSKYRNPFAWGFTQDIGTEIVPQTYAFKVGGGIGTALAVVPNTPTLKMDCELPARCFTLNLRAAGTDAFESSLRPISDIYSVSANSSQFAAVTANGQTVLWGIDFKNYAIVQSDGITQIPISNLIPRIMRQLTSIRTNQLLTHGIYDPRTELNCMWVTTSASLSLVNYLIYQHAPTGYWGFADEQDILSSGLIQDTLTGTNKTFVGTQTGLLGQAFCEGTYYNWNPATGTYSGVITSATTTTITASSAAFNTTNDGMIGNWCLVTDASGATEQWARISAVTATTLTFDWFRSYTGGGTAAFNPTPIAGYLFYVGVIECQLTKYFDFNIPQADKRLMEIWMTQQGVDINEANIGTLIRFYRERVTDYTQFAMLQNKYLDDAPSDAWFADSEAYPELVKYFGLEIINRGYLQWKFINMTITSRAAP